MARAFASGPSSARRISHQSPRKRECGGTGADWSVILDGLNGTDTLHLTAEAHDTESERLHGIL